MPVDKFQKYAYLNTMISTLDDTAKFVELTLIPHSTSTLTIMKLTF